jgi:hypothetical protein
VGKVKREQRGENTIEVHCMLVWKHHNETNLKIARKIKRGRGKES